MIRIEIVSDTQNNAIDAMMMLINSFELDVFDKNDSYNIKVNIKKKGNVKDENS